VKTVNSNYLQEYSECKKPNDQQHAHLKFKNCHMTNNIVKDMSLYPHTNADVPNYRDKLPHQGPVSVLRQHIFALQDV
jgi:hypothetical protein